MARKKPMQYVPREERPEFIAALAALPEAPAELEALAEQYQRTFNAAVLAGHLDVLKGQDNALAAVATKLNGGVSRGALADDGPLAAIIARKAPPLGQVPQWGQDGEFLLEVDGIRIRVRARSSNLNVVLHVDLNVVDLDQLFVSETGYRSTYIWADRSLGLTVDQAVRRDVEQMLAAKGGKPRMVEPDAYVRQRWEGVPAWLADLLAGVKADGQLLMGFGGDSSIPDDKAPLSGAERQRLFRKRQREKKAALKAEGLHTLQISSTDLGRLFIAMDTHLSFNQLLDWDLQGYRELATHLFKGEVRGAAMVQALGTSEGVVVQQKRREKDAKRGWDAYNTERKQNAGMGQKLLQAQEEIKRLQAALQEIVAEVGGTPAAQPAPVDRVDRVEVLQRRVQDLEELNAQEVADRGRAFEAVAVLQARLQKAGLVHDYRKQPGE